jgi:dTDP-4-dehydrorhamnose reductase
LVIDRSLNAAKFRAATGYVAPEWSALIQLMHAYK